MKTYNDMRDHDPEMSIPDRTRIETPAERERRILMMLRKEFLREGHC